MNKTKTRLSKPGFFIEEIFMKHLLFFLLFVFSSLTLAIDPAIVQMTDDYYSILKRVETIKNKSASQMERENAFANFANEFGDPGANWQTLKTSVLEIIAADVGFWANQITAYPAVQEKLINDFEMDWYFETTSNYPEKINSAKVELKKEIENIQLQKASLEAMLKKLESVKPTSLN